ncbi:hypothetical protein CAPTEDRAFT_103368 [Capitella teleta]|uniref:Glycoside hydrolase family 31 N-terminal domain-containing protein n=1 Tax=Capitella teleta TaxID=283909 RepID=R7UWM9_CAPTE|nr:hypothetical protein CAPTEDRAFT_103368 [Capitella teleta]|eukprot:ELU07811.1 hypothetical protein CAPTEDRAFT_103368 [Capitella teleta]
MLGYHWYGLGHVWNHPWPMERWDVKMSPVVTGELEPFKMGEWYGGIQERLWMSSSGVALFVDFNTPLFASVNHQSDGRLRLVAKNVSPYQEDELSMRYTLLQERDVKAAYLSLVGKAFEKPKSIPNEKIFRYPVWSTWAQYKQDITQERVLEFAGAIRKHGFKDSQLEIDDDWTPAYGDWTFDATKFPDPARMVKVLKDLGFRVTIWMHPFANVNSEAIKEKQYWIQEPSTGKPSIVTWWNGKAALLDVTSPSSKSWLKTKCQYLQQLGIDSFKIDAGEACYLPYKRRMHKPLKSPNAYNKLFVDLCLELDPELRALEVRSGVASQHIPMFFRVNDKDSNWSTINGLKTVIPHVLNQGLLGYPFVLPDMIGGNAYSSVGFSKTTNFPSRELFIRWMQVNALMPAMQFSVVPWRYDDEVIHIAQKVCALHEQYADLIVQLAKEATQTGAPICRPLWWIAPKDETALTISSEFLLGNEVLVAPVLDEGATSRDVYLPEGRWRDANSGQEFSGSAWIREHPADLDQLPYFTKL